MESRNAELLASFTRYCEEHPDERFWQALRYWCGWRFVLVSDHRFVGAHDTYYWEVNKKREELYHA